MSFLIFKYCMPVLLGYTLFVGISGRFRLFKKPSELNTRPSWFLGLWIGVSVAVVTGIAIHMAYQLPISEVSKLARPTGVLLAAVIVPGILGYFLYRRDVAEEQRQAQALNASAEDLMLSVEHDDSNSLDLSDNDTIGAVNDASPVNDADMHELEMNDIDTNDATVDDTLVNSEQEWSDDVIASSHDEEHELEMGDIDSVVDTDSDPVMDIDQEDVIAAAEHESRSVSLLFDRVTTPQTDTSTVDSATVEENAPEADDVPMPEEFSSASELGEVVESEQEVELENELEDERVSSAEISTMESTESMESMVHNDVAEEVSELSNDEILNIISSNDQRMEQWEAESKEAQAHLSEQTNSNTALLAEVKELKMALESETHLREHTESHLRVTRKALKNLEVDARFFETDKAEALIEMEEQLAEHVKISAAAKAGADREETQRIAAETEIVTIKQDLLEAKRELRKNTEARAKALATANKSVAFARQSVQARTRAEAKIKQLESQLKLSQETVSSLIVALDKEKVRTQNDVNEMAKELILQQKRISEKKTLDEASRRTQKRLTRRIARKVN